SGWGCPRRGGGGRAIVGYLARAALGGARRRRVVQWAAVVRRMARGHLACRRAAAGSFRLSRRDDGGDAVPRARTAARVLRPDEAHRVRLIRVAPAVQPAREQPVVAIQAARELL